MLQIKNLTITHKRDLRTMIEDLSFTLLPGDKAAVIGEEGNGKSTLLKLIAGVEETEEYAEYTGEIIRNGHRLGYLKQELTPEEKELTILQFCEAFENFYMLTPGELSKIGRQLGLDLEFFYSEQMVGSLSGGEKVKLQLARILMEEPDILLLDEPSNDIDLETLGWLEEFINQSSLPILYISHDETLLEHTANMILHLELVQRKKKPRNTVCRMGYREYMENRGSSIARQEQNAKKERSEFNKKMEHYRQIEQKVEHRQNVITRRDPFYRPTLKAEYAHHKSNGKAI